ncbi:MAG: hypothetical protein ABI855_14325, partial [Bacteroidota bacterium]
MKIIKRIIVALYLGNVNRSEKVKQGNAVKAAVAASPHFTPAETAPLLLVLDAKTIALSVAEAATESGSHESYAIADTAELQYDTAIRNVGYFVQSKADAKPELAEEIILSADMKMKRASVKMKAPRPVQEVGARVTGNGNSIKLLIVSDNPRSTHFEILMTTTPEAEGSWVSIADITKRRFLV